jgi:ribonuclease P protein component
MLPYQNRLIKRKDFEDTYRYGSFFSFGNICLKAKKNSLGKTRIGFSIGLNFSKKAVKRNKIRRQLREISRKNLNHIKKGFDLVIMIKKNRKEDFFSQELEKDLKKALEIGNLIY